MSQREAILCYNRCMARLRNWDYKRPYYYMVTLKRMPGLLPLSVLTRDDPWGVDATCPLTQVLRNTIHDFVAHSPGIEEISPYVIMPDHIHLLIKLSEFPERKSLLCYVNILSRLLRNAYQTHVGVARVNLFEPDWHDLIVKKPNQLKNFRNYIRNNPKMALLRQSHREKFHCYRGYRHWRLGDTPCDLVGNPELLDEPAFLAVKVSRSVLPGSEEWMQLETFYDSWRPGTTAVGTWWSKGEQMVYQKILARGGHIIVLCPDGFGERWHPTGEQAQALCAEGPCFISRLILLTRQNCRQAKRAHDVSRSTTSPRAWKRQRSERLGHAFRACPQASLTVQSLCTFLHNYCTLKSKNHIIS